MWIKCLPQSPPLRRAVCIHVCARSLQLCPTLRPYGVPGSSVHGNSPGKNTEVDCHALLQRFFPTQGLNPRLLCLLHWQAGSLPLAPPGKPAVYIVAFLLLLKLDGAGHMGWIESLLRMSDIDPGGGAGRLGGPGLVSCVFPPAGTSGWRSSSMT